MPNLKNIPTNEIASGASYFFMGAKMLFRPELRKYILIPLLVNCILFFSITAAFIQYFDILTSWSFNLPSWLAWLEFLEKTLKWVAWIVVAIILLIGYGYGFNIITNIIAAPFYGLLAQKTEELLTGEQCEDESIYALIPRTLGRELQKLVYFILRGILILLLIFLLSTIVFLSFLAPIVGILWSAWSMTIQYVDYSADNNQTGFRRLRKKLRKRIYSSVGFGGTVMGCSMIPFINIIAMPAAVIGGTLFWVNELKILKAQAAKNANATLTEQKR